MHKIRCKPRAAVKTMKCKTKLLQQNSFALKIGEKLKGSLLQGSFDKPSTTGPLVPIIFLSSNSWFIVTDCVNNDEFLPPLIFLKLQRVGGIWANSGKFRKSQWNSVGFCMALNVNSVGIPRGFRAAPGF